ncbi:MAG: sensor histidine kinase [Janthinobacterium lividum]
MRLLLFSLFWLSGLACLAQAPIPTGPAAIRQAIATLPDSSQIKQLRSWYDPLVEGGRYGEAQTVLHLVDSIATRSGRDDLRGSAANMAGFLASSLGDYPQAVTCYQQALALARQVGNVQRQVRMLDRLGTNLRLANNPPAAERYLQQALALARQHELRESEADTYGELANLADFQGHPDQALAYADQALAVYRATANWPAYYVALLNQGIHYKNRGRYADSEAAYRQVLAYAGQQHDTFLQGYAHTNLATTLLLAGRPAEAATYAQLALSWVRQVRKLEEYHEVYSVLAQAREQQGDLRQALNYQRLAAAYADTLHDDTQHRQVLQVEARYRTREQQARIAALDQANAQKTRQLWALGLGLLLAAGLLAGNIVQYRTLRRRNAQLQVSTAEASEQARRRTLLLQELHHRVKNNLAIVSSLLYMQATRLSDAGASRAVREGQQRVEAMSLIHQRLYQTDEITAIDLPRYVAELAENLQAAYGHDTHDFDLHLEVTQSTLDVEVAIPLGLILNEMLTNAFKHAYQGVARPLLAVALGPDGAGHLVLDVRDNGPGFVPKATVTDSFGQQLMQVLSEQLGGTLTMSQPPGTHYRLLVPWPASSAAA